MRFMAVDAAIDRGADVVHVFPGWRVAHATHGYRAEPGAVRPVLIHVAAEVLVVEKDRPWVAKLAQYVHAQVKQSMTNTLLLERAEILPGRRQVMAVLRQPGLGQLHLIPRLPVGTVTRVDLLQR